MKKIIITGGSGFLGTALSRELLCRGYEVVSLDLSPPHVSGVHFVETNMLKAVPKDTLLKNPRAIIHLSGKNIFGRFTEEHKRLIRDTRVIGTKHLVALFDDAEYRPEVLISASAIGFYGDRGEETLDESSQKGDGFLSDVVEAWEREAQKAGEYGVRTVCIRNAHILGEGGLLGVLLPYYKWGVGGPLGNGSQWMPWIHIQDLTNLYIKAVEDTSVRGGVNGVAPEQVRNKTFSRTIAKILHRPHVFFIPRWALRLLYGEFADEMTSSQKVLSSKSIYTPFLFPTLREALVDILEE